MVSAEDHRPKSRVPRAEFILATTIAVVSVLVLAMVFALRAENPARERTLRTISLARTVRDETLSLTEAIAAAESARGDILAGRDAWRSRLRAQFEAHATVSRLRAAASGDLELMQMVRAIATIVESDFSSDDTALRDRTAPAFDHHAQAAALPAAIDALIAAVNRRNDAARGAEARTRARLDAISAALGFLSLVASALAMFSLRRERRQWRLANALAEDARARASASDLAKTRFLAAASHDMRQPLHALTLYLSALTRRVKDDEARGILANAERAAQSLVSMFSVLLDLARIEANVITPEFEDVAVQDVLERVAAEHPGADIQVAPTTLIVRSDPVLLERIVRNLVSNAMKHGGGTARLSAADLGHEAQIMVSDDGPGIAPEDQAKVFDEFVRLDGRSASEGLGLGLAIVKRLADLLGHGVSLRSAPGQGAVFAVNAPIARTSARLTATATETTAKLQGQSVIVLDDDPLARNAMAGALKDLGADVVAVATEEDLNAAVARAAPDLVMLDLRLDGRIAGLAIASRLSTQLGPAARLVIVTGDTAADTLAQLRASGHRWLIKPVDPHDLAAAVA
ncbi:MAG: hybrid sensor histidine kinase/response regulator [Hyphomonadaceae bacterium]|nr:hybrid sensor histidine kinase/response regulator [Hyphomonadaceae bacterium]